jgi:hypothetical protein
MLLSLLSRRDIAYGVVMRREYWLEITMPMPV